MRLFGFQIRRTERPTPAHLATAAAAEARQAIGPVRATDHDGMTAVFGGGPVAAGVTVTTEGSLQVSAVYACVRVLSESVASLPFKLYRRLERGRELAREHPLYRVLQVKGNDVMTSMKLREVMMVHLCLWGNAYAEIQRNGRGDVVALWPIHPARVTVKLDTSGPVPALRYEVHTDTGQTVKLRQDQVFHVAGLGTGIVGKSPIQLHREGLGITIAAEQYGAAFFANDARPGFVLKHPATLGDEAYERLKKDHDAMHRGAKKAYRFAILEEGMDVATVGLPPEDAQFIETRKYGRSEIAGIYRVPPHKIADLERATFANIEHQGIEFVTDSLRPWLVRFEQAVTMQLLDEDEQDVYHAEHVVEGLLRGDIQSRYQAYAVGRQWGWLSANDIRELENQNPLPEEQGDIYLQPLNMVSAGTDPFADAGDEGRSQRSAPIEQRALPARYGSAKALERVFRDVLRRVVKREIAEIRKALTTYLEAGDTAGFGDWLVSFAEEHGAWMDRRVLPAFQAMAEAMAEAAQSELEGDVSADDLDEFVRDYVTAFVQRHTGSTRGQLLGLVEEAEANGEDAAEAVEERLDEWEETRADKEARDERQRSSNAFTKAAWALLGVATLTWRSIGKSCPYCQNLDGRSVKISSAFLEKGGSIDDLKVSTRISHPPLHQGCDCILMPGSSRAALGVAERRALFRSLLEDAAGEVAACGHDHSFLDERDAAIRAAYPALKAEMGAYPARLELAERHHLSERQIRRILHEKARR